MRIVDCLRAWVLLSFTCLYVLTGVSQSEVKDGRGWKLIKEEKLFSIFGRKLDDAKFKEIKVKGRIQSSITAIVAALEDIEYQKEWVLRTIDAYEVEKLGTGQYYFYLSTDMPFPIQNRDLVVYYERIQDPHTKIVTTKSKSTPDRVKLKKGFIRIPTFDSYYIIKPMSEGWLSMEYYLNIDPGGSLPPWVVNLAATTGPKSTMRALYRIIESGKFDDVKIEGIEEP